MKRIERGIVQKRIYDQEIEKLEKAQRKNLGEWGVLTSSYRDKQNNIPKSMVSRKSHANDIVTRNKETEVKEKSASLSSRKRIKAKAKLNKAKSEKASSTKNLRGKNSSSSGHEKAKLRVIKKKREALANRNLREKGMVEKKVRDETAAEIGIAKAEARIRERIEYEITKNFTQVNELVSCQTSPIDAMNIARLISPRFEQNITFKPKVSYH